MALLDEVGQTEFHYFRQCEPWSRRTEPGFQGRLAVNGYLYLGVYKVTMYEGLEDPTPETVITFKGLPARRQRSEVEYELKRKGSAEDEAMRQASVLLAKEHMVAARENYIETIEKAPLPGDKMWVDLSERQRLALSLIHARKFTGSDWGDMKLVSVEFVRYDEEIYQALVDYGCTAETKTTGKKVVSLDEEELGIS